MSDPVNRSNQRGAVPEQEPAAGFDVHAAAAGVLAELGPAAQRPTWTAADYGWDPADANAAAWAAYYSELGVDPVALAAQQAAEAAAHGAPQPAAEAAEVATATPDAPAPLDDLSFAPIEHEVAAAEPSGEVPQDTAPDDGGGAVWELLPDPLQPPAPAAPSPAEFRHDLPSGWAADGARLEEFQLASGGSFDEATAPLGDLFGEQDADSAADPAGPLGLTAGLPELTLALEPAAPVPDAAPLPEPAAGDAGPGEVAVELGSLDDLDGLDEPAPAPSTAPALDLDFDGPLAPPAPALDLGWASHAVPAGDMGVDLATFEAEPELELQPPAPDRTAMWGLPAPGAAAPPPPPGEPLGDAAPLPTPAPSPLDPALGDPIDGSLLLEAIEPGTPAATDPWDVPPPQQPDLALADAAGPFDLGALDALAPAFGDAPPAALDAAADEILEVGEDVMEVQPDTPPGPPPAEAPPAPIEPPSPPPPPVEEPPAPAPSGEPAVVAASPAARVNPPGGAYVAGEHRVVVHTADGQVKRGLLCDAALDGTQLELLPQAQGAPEPLATDRVKAIFFMLGTAEPPPVPEGKKVRVTFRDGRQVAGFSPDYDPERVGFFMVPADTRTHTARIWVYRSAVRQVAVSG